MPVIIMHAVDMLQEVHTTEHERKQVPGVFQSSGKSSFEGEAFR